MMGQSLQLSMGIPLPIAYLLCALLVIPLVHYGMRTLATLQMWTTPLWLIMMVVPMVHIIRVHPDAPERFMAYPGVSHSENIVQGSSVCMSMGVCLSLICQIAEQIDYLRFMPPKTKENSFQWWSAMILGGPGWVIFGAAKQIVGMFIAVFILNTFESDKYKAYDIAAQPVHQFMIIYKEMMPEGLALALATFLVCVSQVKINVTNAYSGSLAWTNSYTRFFEYYPKRIYLVIFNVGMALILMECDMFEFLDKESNQIFCIVHPDDQTKSLSDMCLLGRFLVSIRIVRLHGSEQLRLTSLLTSSYLVSPQSFLISDVVWLEIGILWD